MKQQVLKFLLTLIFHWHVLHILIKQHQVKFQGGGGGSLQKLLHNSVAQKWVRAVSYELKSH